MSVFLSVCSHYLSVCPSVCPSAHTVCLSVRMSVRLLTFRPGADVDAREMFHQQELLGLLSRHQPRVLIRAGGERLLQLRLLLVQRGHVGLVLLFRDSERKERLQGEKSWRGYMMQCSVSETILLILTTERDDTNLYLTTSLIRAASISSSPLSRNFKNFDLRDTRWTLELLL